jgi:hypothetical protein
MSETNTFRKQWEDDFDWHREGLRPGGELDWYAVDSEKQVACFMTSGFAFVPKLVFRDKETLWSIYNYFYQEPEDYTYVRQTSSLWEYDVSLHAKRGLYSYDNPSDIDKPYELVRTPKVPIHISDLLPEIREWLEPLTIKELSFANTPMIDMRKYFECI